MRGSSEPCTETEAASEGNVAERQHARHVDVQQQYAYVDDHQHTTPMTTPLNSAAVGALVHETRLAAGLTQTQLGERIGASRFWVAAFEKGKPSAELGLALKAIHALGLAITIAPQQTREHQLKADTSLASVVALATLTHAAPSSVTGWPSIPASRRLPKPTTSQKKR